MESSAGILPFRHKVDPLARHGLVILSPTPGPHPDALRPLYRKAIGDTELETDPDGQLAKSFGRAEAVRYVAFGSGPSASIHGFALAVPVSGRQELADALAFNQFDPHVSNTLSRARCWALLVAVSTFNVGIARALANQSLDAILDARGERVYVAARARDHRLVTKLLKLGFTRDGLSVEAVPRTLFSRDVSFVF